MKNNIFCIKRLFLLSRRQILSNSQKYAVGFGSIVGALLVITLLSGIRNPFFHVSSLFPLYIVIFLLGGYVFTSSVFAELNSPQRSVAALTLPASKLERLVNAWFLSAVLYPVFVMLGMVFISIVTSIVHGQDSTSNLIQVIFSKSTFSIIRIYIITQSIFLFGAIYFRKNNFFKTIGSVILIQFVFQVVLIAVAYILFGSQGLNDGVGEMTLTPGLEKFFSLTLFELIKFGFYYVLAPFFLLLTWFGIKEREV